MAKFQIRELVGEWDKHTVRFGAGTGAANNWADKETGKFVKLVGDSRFDLCAVGDPIEGWVVSQEVATQDGFTLGTKGTKGIKGVVFDGLQATPGTGVLAVGDYVVCGTPVAKGTALPTEFARVCRATDQTNTGVKGTSFAMRVVSLGNAGTGAVGTVGYVEWVA